GESDGFKFSSINVDCFTSFDIKFMKRSENEIQKDFSFNLGLKFKDKLRLCYQYYSGYDIHGELNSFFSKTSSVGIYLVL
ncbi:MAG: hypothetical protein N3A61_03095, partial [Ignavibacteria bacterium]|nr:hypothetical protein [Ignavibacteria bacterium]